MAHELLPERRAAGIGIAIIVALFPVPGPPVFGLPFPGGQQGALALGRVAL